MLITRRHLAPRTARLTCLAILVAALAGCQGIANIQPTSQVRVIDVSPDSPALDIHQTSAQSSPLALYNIGFGTVSSYVPVTAGPTTHAAYSAGTQQQLAQIRGTLAPGSQYTLLAGNVAANLQMTVLKDQSYPAPPGQVAFRFLNQATRAGAIDLYLLPHGAAPIVRTAAPGHRSQLRRQHRIHHRPQRHLLHHGFPRRDRPAQRRDARLHRQPGCLPTPAPSAPSSSSIRPPPPPARRSPSRTPHPPNHLRQRLRPNRQLARYRHLVRVVILSAAKNLRICTCGCPFSSPPNKFVILSEVRPWAERSRRTCGSHPTLPQTSLCSLRFSL